MKSPTATRILANMSEDSREKVRDKADQMVADHTAMILKALSVRNLTQAQLADYSGISRSHVNQILSHKRTMQIRQAKGFEKVLKILTARELLIAQIDYKLREV